MVKQYNDLGTLLDHIDGILVKLQKEEEHGTRDDNNSDI